MNTMPVFTVDRINAVMKRLGGATISYPTHKSLDDIDRQLGVSSIIPRASSHYCQRHGYDCPLPRNYVGARLARIEETLGNKGYFFWLGANN